MGDWITPLDFDLLLDMPRDRQGMRFHACDTNQTYLIEFQGRESAIFEGDFRQWIAAVNALIPDMKENSRSQLFCVEVN
ncbi:MAG: hypothetical protein F6J95_028140 [Leptolyngbya sp. SIO1E4]|nr:hypothetical protein [Leptolyngbya sp. SIO1E4]